MRYMDGFVVPVPKGKQDDYVALAQRASTIFLEHGALRVVECWGDDIPAGKTNDFRTAVIAEPDEHVVFSWIEWPDKATRDAGMAKVMSDERMKPDGELPFSGARMIYGGFATVVDTAA
ncbi:DUF1428 domain-containing protein [Sphingobium subterraneum]|uniref:Uncharacterized protein YbaA (DUF1428 family) n=1 Tax=Sphingobium subterraneum TaxID=627688 RepID=A0A841J2T0_9SPHN|nr:DUF1428 domain-containing protein [Sphingobium subterraneum]MBB6124980.1 uncharacterized protein YbaA (DUF1428 family) [Sphingobium subterraneum]